MMITKFKLMVGLVAASMMLVACNPDDKARTPMKAEQTAAEPEVVLGTLETDLVPGSVDYSILLPPGYSKEEKLPLLLHLHGGGADRNYMPSLKPMYTKLWADGSFPRMVVASISGRGSYYANSADGKELWEDFIFDYMKFIQENYNTMPGKEYNYITGISMGGVGTLRLGFLYSDKFGAIAAMEAGIDPVLDYADLQPRNYAMRHIRPPEEQAKSWGWPVDPEKYKQWNIANIVVGQTDKAKENGLKIFFEVGSRDWFNFQDGGEFLHRLLWERCVPHEYRALLDADHWGPSLNWRYEEVHRWIGRMSQQLINPQPMDKGLKEFRERMPEHVRKYMNDSYGGIYRDKCGS